MPTARPPFSPSSPLAGLARRGRHCPRPKRVVRRAARLARLRAVLSVAGVVGMVGIVMIGGFWLLRGPAAVADTGGAAPSAVESLLVSTVATDPADAVRPSLSAMAVRVDAAPVAD